MKPLLNIDKWLNSPEGRMKLMRIFLLIALGMLVLGYILIILDLLVGIFP